MPGAMDPYLQLGITPSTSFAITKKVVIRELVKPERQARAMASLAYHMITSSGKRYDKKDNMYQIQNRDIHFYAAIGHTEMVLDKITSDPSLVDSADEQKRRALYLSARCGFCDTTEALIRMGANVNHQQLDDSTPLHAAAFYGQKQIVEMLLVYGADPSLKNKHESTPADESSSNIRNVFDAFNKTPMDSTVAFFKSSGFVETIHFIHFQGKRIGVEMLRNVKLLDSITTQRWDSIKRDWEIAFHGTKYRYVTSILKSGLNPSGSQLKTGETITPPSNHFQLNQTYFKIDNWGSAIFCSPDILYACHPCYSEHIIIGGSQWCVLLKVYLRPKSYQVFNSTVHKDYIDGEPTEPEFRIRGGTVDSIVSIALKISSIADCEAARKVVVQSVMFISKTFLDEASTTHGLFYEQIHGLFT